WDVATGIQRKVRGMRHVGPVAVARRGLMALQRLLRRTGSFAALSLDRVSPEAWLAKFASPSEQQMSVLLARCGTTLNECRIALRDARHADEAAVRRSLAAIERQRLSASHVLVLSDKKYAAEQLAMLPGSLLFWIEAGEEPVGHAFITLAAALAGGGEVAF